MKNYLKLAEMLKNSNIPEVSELANAYIELYEQNKIIEDRFIHFVSDHVMDKYHETFEELRKQGD